MNKLYVRFDGCDIHRHAKRFAGMLVAVAAGLAAGLPAYAIDITVDTHVTDAELAAYNGAAINVAKGATLTFDIAPTAAFKFGLLTGGGDIVVHNNGSEAVGFVNNTFKDFTGTLTGDGSKGVSGGGWNYAWHVNGRLDYTGAFNGYQNIEFHGADVFGDGVMTKIGHGSQDTKAKYMLNGFDQALAHIGFSILNTKQPVCYSIDSSSAATMTVTGDAVAGNDKTVLVAVNDKASFVWASETAATFTLRGTSTTDGRIAATGGMLTLASTSSFDNLTTLEATGTGVIVVEEGARIRKNVNVVVASESSLLLPEGFVLQTDSLTIGGVKQTSSADFRFGDGIVRVLIKTAGTWVGGTDDHLETTENWKDEVKPNLADGAGTVCVEPTTGVTCADFGTDLLLDSMDFSLSENFTLSALSPAKAKFGSSAWDVPTGSALTISAGMASDSDCTVTKTGGGDVRIATGDSGDFLGCFSASDGSKIYLDNSQGFGGAGARIVLGSTSGLKVTTSMTNRSAITWHHGGAQSWAPAGVEFVQLGPVTNDSGGAQNSAISVTGTLRFKGGVRVSPSHRANPEGYKWWRWQFNIDPQTGSVWIEDTPIDVGLCNFILLGVSGVSGAFHLAATDNVWNCFILGHGSKLICEDENVLSPNGDVGFYSDGFGSIDLNGHDQTMANLTGASATGSDASIANASAAVKSASPATLTLTGSRDITLAVVFTGEAALTYSGSCVYTMTNLSAACANSTKGSLKVMSGTVRLAGGFTWANTTNVVVSGSGKLVLDATTAAKSAPLGRVGRDSAAVVRLSDAGAIEVPEGVTLTVNKLYVDGEPQPKGTVIKAGDGYLTARYSDVKTGLILLLK